MSSGNVLADEVFRHFIFAGPVDPQTYKCMERISGVISTGFPLLSKPRFSLFPRVRGMNEILAQRLELASRFSVLSPFSTFKINWHFGMRWLACEFYIELEFPSACLNENQNEVGCVIICAHFCIGDLKFQGSLFRDSPSSNVCATFPILEGAFPFRHAG